MAFDGREVGNRLVSTSTVLTSILLASRKDSDFQIYKLEGRSNMLKLTIRFKHESVLGTIVSYQATSCTHPSASSVFETSAPEHEPPPFELILRKEEPGDKSGISDDDDSREKGDLPKAFFNYR